VIDILEFPITLPADSQCTHTRWRRNLQLQLIDGLIRN
jgi:hypothetical protein